jgi:PAS domain S-box-containing protein
MIRHRHLPPEHPAKERPVNSEVQNPEADVAHALARFEALRARIREDADNGLLDIMVHELSTSLEELRVASEANREQSDALAATREALFAERRAFQMLFEFAPDGYLVTDRLGKILRANRMAGELFGVPLGNLVGKPLTVFIGLDGRSQFRSVVRRLSSGNGGMRSFEGRLIARGGRSFDASIRVTGGGEELRWAIRDVTEQHRAHQALRDAHQGLEARTGELRQEIAERRLAEEHLAQSEGRYRDLSAHLQAGIEEERSRIAREVHDELGSALTAVRFELARAVESSDEPARDTLIKASIGRIDAAIRTTRRICSDLRPSLLDHMGLWAAIEWLVEDVGERAGLQCTVDLARGGEVNEAERSTAVFRIVQEAVTNVVRHAGAKRLSVTARTTGNEVFIDVSDDGRGIGETELARPDAFGIIGMQERARACGGRVAIERGAGRGTRVRMRVPLAANP